MEVIRESIELTQVQNGELISEFDLNSNGIDFCCFSLGACCKNG